jgi:hypothetical protein
MTVIRLAAGACAIAFAIARPVSAQTTIDVYGGLAAARIPGGGTVTMPAAGPPILTSNPIFPSRQTSTWFLGDGAALLNDAVTDLGILNRIAAVDPALASLPFEHRVGAAFGVRVRRPFRSRFALEVSVDVLASRARATDAFAAAADAARTSFQDTFSALFATGPFVNTVVDATTEVSAGSSRRVAVRQFPSSGAVSHRRRRRALDGRCRTVGDDPRSLPHDGARGRADHRRAA